MTYSEDTLISRKPKNIAELKISDIATKEFLEALESIDALPDWEVVFPDCPLKSERGVNNMFSVPGYASIHLIIYSKRNKRII